MIKMYVGIVGSRRFKDVEFIERLMEGIVKRFGGGVVFVSGDCGSGVDEFVRVICERRSWNLVRCCVNRRLYGVYGNKLYYWRNLRIVKMCDVVYCVVERGYCGKGSKMVFELCKRYGVKVVWLEVDDGKVVRVDGDVDCKEYKNGFCLVLGEKCKYVWWNCKLRKICEEIRKESEVK